MRPQCAASVRAAAGGRQISDAKLKAIDDAISGNMRELARRDATRWRGLSLEQRLNEAAAKALADLDAEAGLKEFRANLQALRAADAEVRLADHAALNKLTRSQATIRDIELTNNHINAVRDESVAGLADLIDAAESRDGTGAFRNLGMRLFDLDNPQMTADVVREVWRNADGFTGNKAAQAGAKAWLEVIEGMRQRFNAAGGSIGKLAYGYLSQVHDQMRVRGDGKAAARDAWVNKVIGLLDRKQYLREDGAAMGDAEVLDVLRAAWETISTNGDNKTAPGQFKGAGARAKHGADHRVLHFKDGDAWMQYMADYGEGSLYDSMLGHIGAMARDIGLVERYGPNPEQWFRVQSDLAQRADGRGTLANRSAGNTPEAYWALVSGKTGMPENRFVARVGQDARNIQTAAKLGGAVLSSLTDMGTIAAGLHFNRLPYFQMLANIGRQFTKEQREFLRAHAVIGESLVSSMNRFTGDHMTHNLTGRVANSVMKLSLMNAWTDGLRGAFSATMMQGFAKKLGKTWAQLDDWDRYLMQRKGLTEADWSVITQAKATDRNGSQYLTADAIRSVSDQDLATARPAEFKRISDSIAAQTAELTARNQQDRTWISGRMDRFDDARDALNRQVKARLDRRLKANEEATGPMLERMALLDAQREQAKLQVDMEADFNRYVTQDEVRTFLNAVEDGASADKTAAGSAKREVRRGLEAAESAGRRYGVQKGRLERRMVEIENRIRAMDREATSAANKEGKAAQKKADDMRQELADFIARSQDRQARRVAVIDRLNAEEAPRLAAEAQRMRSEIATKWLAFVSDEAQFAIINPDMATRAIVTGGGMPAGRVDGEAMRAFMQFKSFPTAMLTRHWRRVFETPQGLEGAPLGFGAQSRAGGTVNRIALLAALNTTLMMLGALVLQNKTLVQGKDPFDMTEGKFWMRALAQGGGAGYLGDFLFKDPTEQRGNTYEQAAGSAFGPAVGAAVGLVVDVGVVNAWQVAKGKDAKAAAEAVRWLNSQLPYVNLWQTRAAWEHWVIHNMQESLNPGYLSRMERRAQKDWGQGYWWAPGEALPDRAPDFGRIAGE